jgi:putative RecB family exonuclease
MVRPASVYQRKGEIVMEIKELRKKPHLSHSSINAYMECGLYYKFSKIDKLKPQFTSDNLVYGITVHRVLADFHQERLIGKLLSADELCDLFAKYWKQAAENKEYIKYSKNNSYDSILSGGKALLSAYHRHLPKDLYTIVAIEEPFSITFDGLDVPIIGVMDLVEEDSAGTIVITENKTSARAYSNSQIDKNLQLTVYQIAARSNGYKKREILLRIDCLIKTQVPTFKTYYTHRNSLDEYRAIRKIIKVWDGIKKSVFIPNDTSWKCAYCEFKDPYCDQWFAEGYGGNNGRTE